MCLSLWRNKQWESALPNTDCSICIYEIQVVEATRVNATGTTYNCHIFKRGQERANVRSTWVGITSRTKEMCSKSTLITEKMLNIKDVVAYYFNTIHDDLRRRQIAWHTDILSICASAADYLHNSNVTYRHNVTGIRCSPARESRRRQRAVTSGIAWKERAFPFPSYLNFALLPISTANIFTRTNSDAINEFIKTTEITWSEISNVFKMR